MNDLLITTIAEGRYVAYRELFLTFVRHAYPEYDSKVYTIQSPSAKYFGACQRFIHKFCEYDAYKYVYITDIDMMIVREDPTLLKFHTDELAESGLCYSNTPRGNELRGFERLTGLHFVDSSWWEVTHEARTRYSTELMIEKVGNESIDDELILMKIVKESGLPLPVPKKDLVCRHHGVHLGTIRAYKKSSIQVRRNRVGIRVDTNRAKRWCETMALPEIGGILQRMRSIDRMAYDEVMEMNKFCKQLSKGK
jgi:hypothetical protein